MTRIEKAKARMASLIGKFKLAQEQLRSAVRNSLILCPRCKTKSALWMWTFIQDMHYVSPYSCNEGDYWSAQETKCCHLVCPKCNMETYIYNHPHVENIVELVDSHKFRKSVLFDAVVTRHNR